MLLLSVKVRSISVRPLLLLLGVPSHGVPEQLADVESDLIVHVEVGGVLVVRGWLLVVDGSQGVESSCNLEHLGHFVLKELLRRAVVVETVVTQVPEHLLDLTLIIEHVINFKQESVNVHYVLEVEIAELSVDVVKVPYSVLSKAVGGHLVVIVLVEASSEPLKTSSPFLDGQVDLPHDFFGLNLLGCFG